MGGGGPEAVDVRPMIDRPAGQLFGGGVGRRPQGRARGGQVGGVVIGRGDLGQTEIGHLHGRDRRTLIRRFVDRGGFVGDQQIAGFDVPVDDPLPKRVTHCLGDLPN